MAEPPHLMCPECGKYDWLVQPIPNSYRVYCNCSYCDFRILLMPEVKK